MQNIIIDEEFKDLLPALDKETFELLEENILKNGCRDSLVLWGDILIDGHNRYAICTKHDILFNTVNKDFSSREEVMIWLISTQVSRRNLTQIQLSHYRGLHYNADKKIVSNMYGKNQYSEVERHSDEQPKEQNTKTRLSKKYRVSTKTIERDAKIADAIESIGKASPEAKRMILASEVKIDKKDLAALSGKPIEKIEAVAVHIEEGTYEKPKPETPESPEPEYPVYSTPAGTQPLNTVINDIADSFYSELQELTKNGNTAELKTALRSYIDMLEDLYRKI